MSGCHGDGPVIFHLLKTQESSISAAKSWTGRGGASASQLAGARPQSPERRGRVGDAAG